MGAWGLGPFDNDTAADFAHDVRACDTLDHPLPARTALLLHTMREVIGGDATIHPDEPGRYELDYRVERAVAAVAFTADAVTGICCHTDNSFARGVGDDGEYLPQAQFEPVSPALHSAAMAVLSWVDHRLVMDQTGREFARELHLLYSDLATYDPAHYDAVQ
jgi:hypothetical protein